MKIALAQINTQIGNLEANAKKAISFMQQARKKGADLVIFPELTIPGYPPKDLLEKPHFVQANVRALQDVVHKTLGISAIVGFAEPSRGERGRPVFNSAALIQNGRIQAVSRKILL